MTKNNSVIQELSSFYTNINNYDDPPILITRIPPHMNYQLYFYSQGHIDPRIEQEQPYDINTFGKQFRSYLLLDDFSQQEAENIPSLKNINVEKLPIIWSQADMDLFELR